MGISSSFGTTFGMIMIFGVLIFLGVAVAVVIIGIKTVRSRSGEETSARAAVRSKRTQFVGGESSYTYYYVTFELLSGERIELGVNGKEFGLLAEGDTGVLTMKGKSFAGFTRDNVPFAADDPDRAHKCPACGAAYKGSVCPYCDTPYTE